MVSVGGTQAFGTKYAMRIWLDPGKLDSYNLSVAEVTAALQAQNAQVAVGQLGGAPSVEGQQLNATITAQDRLQTPEQFRAILLRTQADGSALRLGDVARVEMGAESYGTTARYNGKPASGMAIMLAWRDYLRDQLRDWLPADRVESAETDAVMLKVVTRLIRESTAPGRHSVELGASSDASPGR